MKRSADLAAICLLFAGVVTLHLTQIPRELTPWLQITVPTLTGLPNSVLGYSTVVDGHIMHKENRPSFDHVIMLLGGPIAKDFYSLRAVYAYLASFAAPFFGLKSSFIGVNAAAWLAASIAAYLFTREALCYLSNQKVRGGALIAAGSTLLAPAFWYHLTDLSAHLLSFSTYFLSAYALVRSRVWKDRLDGAQHLLLCAILSLGALTYNTGIALVAVYVFAAAMGKNKIVYIGLTAFVAIAFAAAWPSIMNAFADAPTDYREVEARYLARAVSDWLSSAQSGELPGRLVGHLAEFIMSNLVTYCTGAIALLVVVVTCRPDWRLLLLLIALWSMPLIMALIWAPAAGARGYLVAHGQIVAYAAMGIAATASCVGRRLRAGVLAITFFWGSTQMALLTSVASGNPFPLQNYLGGHLTEIASLSQMLRSDSVRIVEMTHTRSEGLSGLESAADELSALRAPMERLNGTHKAKFADLVRAVTMRLYIGIPIGIIVFLIALGAISRRGTAWNLQLVLPLALSATLVLMLSVLPPLVAVAGREVVYSRSSLFLSERIPPGGRVEVDVSLSESAIMALSERCGDAEPSQLAVRLEWAKTDPANLASFDISVGRMLVAHGQGEWSGIPFSCRNLLNAIEKLGHRTLMITVTPIKGACKVLGWQKPYPGARVGTMIVDGNRRILPFAPSLELLISGTARFRRSAILY